MQKLNFTIGGMTCGGCAKSVDKVIAQVAGVTAHSVSHETGRAVVEGNFNPQDVIQAVEDAGFDAALAE